MSIEDPLKKSGAELDESEKTSAVNGLSPDNSGRASAEKDAGSSKKLPKGKQSENTVPETAGVVEGGKELLGSSEGRAYKASMADRVKSLINDGIFQLSDPAVSQVMVYLMAATFGFCVGNFFGGLEHLPSLLAGNEHLIHTGTGAINETIVKLFENSQSHQVLHPTVVHPFENITNDSAVWGTGAVDKPVTIVPPNTTVPPNNFEQVKNLNFKLSETLHFKLPQVPGDKGHIVDKALNFLHNNKGAGTGTSIKNLDVATPDKAILGNERTPDLVNTDVANNRATDQIDYTSKRIPNSGGSNGAVNTAGDYGRKILGKLVPNSGNTGSSATEQITGTPTGGSHVEKIRGAVSTVVKSGRDSLSKFVPGSGNTGSRATDIINPGNAGGGGTHEAVVLNSAGKGGTNPGKFNKAIELGGKAGRALSKRVFGK